MLHDKQDPESGLDKRFRDLIERIWTTLLQDASASDLARVRGYLSIMDGVGHVPPNTSERIVFRKLYFPGLSASPFLSATQTGVKLSRSSFDDISEEWSRAFSCENANVIDHSNLLSEPSSGRDRMYLCAYLKKDFEWIESAIQNFPLTANYLQKYRVGSEAFFSSIKPGAQIPEHSDGANYVSTVHIPIRLNNSSLTVAGTTHDYRAGELVCFDSTFVHRVDNFGADSRDILLFNIWHPELTDVEIWAIERIRNIWEGGFLFDPDHGPRRSLVDGN